MTVRNGAQTSSLGEILGRVEHLAWDSVLFLPTGPAAWTPQTPAQVAGEAEIDDDDVHAGAALAGLRYAVTVADAQDVKFNLLAQRPMADAAALVEALRFYFVNDAFFRLDGAVD